jgi:hypothetical protein
MLRILVLLSLMKRHLCALARQDQPARNPEKKSPVENPARPQQERKT